MRLFKPNVEKMEKSKDVNGLMKALKDKDEHVRWVAAWALGEMGDARAFEWLTSTAKDRKEDSVVRWEAKRALEKIKAKKS